MTIQVHINEGEEKASFRECERTRCMRKRDKKTVSSQERKRKREAVVEESAWQPRLLRPAPLETLSSSKSLE